MAHIGNIKIAVNNYITSITTVKYKQYGDMYVSIEEVIHDLRVDRVEPTIEPCYMFEKLNDQLWLWIGQPAINEKGNNFRVLPDKTKCEKFMVVNDINLVPNNRLEDNLPPKQMKSL